MARLYIDRKFKRGEFGKCGNIEQRQRVQDWKDTLRRENATEAEYHGREFHYEKHRARLNKMRADPRIAVYNERFHRAGIVNEINYHRRLQNTADIEIQNALALVRLRNVYAEDRGSNFKLDDTKVFNLRDRGLDKALRLFELSQKNIEMKNRLVNVRSLVQSRQELKEWYKVQEEKMQSISRFPLYWIQPMKFDNIWKPGNGKSTPLVYLDFEVEKSDTIGRIYIELYHKLVPKTAENFRQLCINEKYVGIQLDHIIPDTLWQGGKGIDSAYGGYFPDENYKVKHDSPGIVSMVNFGKGKNRAEFRILAFPSKQLNSKTVAFGKVLLGMPFLKQLFELCKPSENGICRFPAIIIGSGETTLQTIDTLPPVKSTYEQNLEYYKCQKSGQKPMPKKFSYIRIDDQTPTSSSEDLEE